MNNPQEFNYTILITVVTILASAISIIITKLFENRQNFLKHKRIITEKIIDSKLEACNNAIRYYGTYLNYLYNLKSSLESLESYDYSKLVGSSNKIYEESLSKIQSEGNFHQIILFYDFYGIEDEKIAEKIKYAIKEYFEYGNTKEIQNSNEEKRLRQKLIVVLTESINYFKNINKLIRDDLNESLK